MTVYDGPRTEIRRILHDGRAQWATVEEDHVELPDGRVVATEEAIHLPPVEPSTIICVHMNFDSRRQEFGLPPIDAPTYFTKPVTTLNAHRGTVTRPGRTTLLNFEGELAVVIGRPTRNIAPNEVADHIAGFTTSGTPTPDRCCGSRGRMGSPPSGPVSSAASTRAGHASVPTATERSSRTTASTRSSSPSSTSSPTSPATSRCARATSSSPGLRPAPARRRRRRHRRRDRRHRATHHLDRSVTLPRCCGRPSARSDAPGAPGGVRRARTVNPTT